MSKTTTITIVCFPLLLVFILFLLGISIRLSDLGTGTHNGYVTAVDQRGYIFHNYEVYFKTDNSSSQEDMYCVHEDNKALAGRLRELSQTGERATIEYKGVRGFGLDLCHAAEITGVKIDKSNIKF